MIPTSIRSQFPGVSNLVYFDTASRGLAPASAKVSMDAQIDQHVLGTIEKQSMFDLIERVRGRYASLLRAHPDEIAFTKNVSEGLNMAACALPWRAGDNVVLCPRAGASQQRLPLASSEEPRRHRSPERCIRATGTCRSTR